MHRPQSSPDELRHLLQDADTPLIRGIVGFMTAQQHAIERIAESLNDNTTATRKIQETIAAHVEAEEKFQVRIETGIVTSRVVTSVAASIFVIVGGAMLSLMMYVWNQHIAENGRDSAEQRVIADRLTKLEQRLSVIEAQRP